MKRLVFGVFSIFLLLWAVATADESDPFRIKSKAKRGKDHSVQVEFEAFFPVTSTQFWNVVTNYGSYSKFVPQVSDAEYLGKLRGMDRVYLAVEMPFPLPDVWNILDVQEERSAGFLEWKMRKGNMEKNQGSFQVDSVGGGVKIKGEAYVNPGAFIPNRLVVWASKHYTPRLLRAFGREMTRKKKEGVQKAVRSSAPKLTDRI